MRVAFYARVSTLDQDTAMQFTELREYAAYRKWEVVGEYVDKGISGKREKRPSLDRLMADATRRKFDVVCVWRFDRFGRSVAHLLRALETFNKLGVEFVSLKEAIDTSTEMGKMVFTFLAAIAAFEHAILKERIKAGLREARAKGKVLGHPRLAIDDQIIELRASGLSLRVIAKQLGVSLPTVWTRTKALAAREANLC